MEHVEFFKKLLEQNELFKGLPSASIALIAGCAKNAHFKEGELLFDEGQNADTFYIIREGLVAIDMVAGEQDIITIQTVDPGEVVGWSWLFPPYEWNFRARAILDTRAVALDAKCLRGKLEQDSALGYELMKRFSAVVVQRLARTRLQVLDIFNPHPSGT